MRTEPDPRFLIYTWWTAERIATGWQIKEWESTPGEAKRQTKAITSRIVTLTMMGHVDTSLPKALAIMRRDFAEHVPGPDDFIKDPRDQRSKKQRYITRTTTRSHP